MTMFIKTLGLSRRVSRASGSALTLALALAFFVSPAQAAQTGEISGQVSDANGAAAGVSIEADGDVLPQARTTTSAANGKYRFRLLPPGNYKVKFTFADGGTQTRQVFVLLEQTSKLDVSSIGGADMEEIVVTGSPMMADTGQGALKNSISADTIDALPVGQEYRDLMKLIPGVVYTENSVRGPSAGGSGQDNTYLFDGVDVSLPLFGVLSSEPSTHDIAQVSIVRGGAKAIGFNRSGGFLINTVSKRGTDEFHGEVSYQVQTSSMTGDLDTGDSPESFDEDRTWTTISLGGPIISDHLYFYTSYYRPDHSRSNTANAYGMVGNFEDVRDEFFGKLSFAPNDSILLDASFRTSDHQISNDSIGPFEAATASLGSEAQQDILILEGSWIISDRSSLNFKYTDFELLGSDRPDTQFNFSVAEGDSLDINNLDQMGYFIVPAPRTPPVDATPEEIAAYAAYNLFAQPLITKYGYDDGGVQTGGGRVGGYYRYSDGDYFRESFEIGFDQLIYAGNATHDIHIGYQYMDVAEDLARFSNGWGTISAPGGLSTDTAGNPLPEVFFQASVYQQSLADQGGAALVPVIHSSSELQSFEINDTIEIGDWTYNIGVMFSNDVFFGQGLAAEPNNPLSGFTASPGTPYKMYEVDWSDMIQPRLGVNWDYSDTGSVYANFAQYNPSASSLARAASWDRNLRSALTLRWDADGNYLGRDSLNASSGKQFVDGIKPRVTNEFLIGTTQEISSELTLRAHARYRKSYHFWEDTYNWGRQLGSWTQFAPDSLPREPYIENLDDIRSEIGGGPLSGSSYVIAELDFAFTKYYEASVEVDWNVDKLSLHGSYTWSHYFGNFDQDTTTVTNDQAIFIGSSNLADSGGMNVWDFKKGNLGGDRRHKLKVYGFYQLDWNASVGVYYILQSGEPWEKWDGSIYNRSTDTIRFAETAGIRTTSSHYQLDLTYIQNFEAFGESNVQLRLDIFNATDNQTGYNIRRRFRSPGFGEPNSFYKPRRIQVAVKYQF